MFVVSVYHQNGGNDFEGHVKEKKIKCVWMSQEVRIKGDRISGV